MNVVLKDNNLCNFSRHLAVYPTICPTPQSKANDPVKLSSLKFPEAQLVLRPVTAELLPQLGMWAGSPLLIPLGLCSLQSHAALSKHMS